MMNWKPNWAETRGHFCDWWSHKGLVLTRSGGFKRVPPHEATVDPGPPGAGLNGYTDSEWVARQNHHGLAHCEYPADTLPISATDIGPGSLALLLGSEPDFGATTVWFDPAMKQEEHPERRPPLKFDPANRWWKVHENTLRACVEMGRGKYLTGCPDLVENVDVLASLRDAQLLLMDMIERPEWVEEKIGEINQVWFEVYDRVYDIIKREDGSACFGAFNLWGPGKTAKVQCDASAMFSPAMFERFVVPALTAQCEWLDHSMYHLDGHQCLCNLDALLGIKALDAIEWTPDPAVPSGGNARWYPLYRRILAAGKSVQAVGVRQDEVIPLLDAVGGKGLYIMTWGAERKAFERISEQAAAYR
jgi:hypothetical protein